MTPDATRNRPAPGSLPQNTWPLAASIMLFVAVIASLYHISLSRTEGHFTYTLDDAYIHMAMAKNFAHHGVWGVTPHGFSSSTSSPLWTLLLAIGFRIGGLSERLPLALNILCGLGIILFLEFRLRRLVPIPFVRFMLLNFIVYTLPLPAIIFTGMENTLHALLSLIMLDLGLRLLERERPHGPSDAALLALAPLLVAARFEGAFLICVLGILLALLRGRWRFALVLYAAGAAPVILYGLLSLSKGWLFLPNSLMLKGNMPQGLTLLSILRVLYSPLKQLRDNPHLLILTLMVVATFYLQYRRRCTFRDPGVLASLTAAMAIGLHLMFAKAGWFYRYEAYLFGLGMYALCVGWRESLAVNRLSSLNRQAIPQAVALAAMIGLLYVDFLFRAGLSFYFTPSASRNIYQQQIQMARFTEKFYAGRPLAINDVGAINYFTDIQLLDTWGLATMETARAKRGGYYNTGLIDQLARGRNVRVAMIYDMWADEFGGVPRHWTKVGEWKILGNVVCASNIVAFYATDPAAADELRRTLAAFDPAGRFSVRLFPD